MATLLVKHCTKLNNQLTAILQFYTIHVAGYAIWKKIYSLLGRVIYESLLILWYTQHTMRVYHNFLCNLFMIFTVSHPIQMQN